MPEFKKILTEAGVLALAFWVTGLLLNTVKIPLLSVPTIDFSTNLIGAYLGLVVAVYIKDWIAPKLKLS